MDVSDGLGELSDKLCGTTTVDGVGRNDRVRGKYRVVKNLHIVMDHSSVAYHTAFAYCYIISYFEGADDAVLVDVNVVAYGLFDILDFTLLFHVARSDDHVFSDDDIHSYLDVCEVASQDRG